MSHSDFISLEAWSAAFTLDTAIENYFLEYGLVRSKDTPAPIIEAMARTVQKAINESLEREARNGVTVTQQRTAFLKG